MNTYTLNVEPADRTVGSTTAPSSAAQSSTAQKIAFFLVWAAVAVPLVWGVLKAWNEVRLMF